MKRMMTAVISAMIGAALTTCAAAHEREVHVTPDRSSASDCEEIMEKSADADGADPLAIALSEQCRRIGDEHGAHQKSHPADEASLTGERT